MLRSGKATYVWDDEMKVPYLVQGDQWVGFDDERAIRNKMDWIKKNNFGGAMVWTLDMDDFTGSVCGNDVKYPLIGAMRCRNCPRCTRLERPLIDRHSFPGRSFSASRDRATTWTGRERCRLPSSPSPRCRRPFKSR